MADLTRGRIAELLADCELMQVGSATFSVPEVRALLDMASRCVSEETLRKLARVSLVTGNPLGTDTVERAVLMKNLAAVISDLTDAAEALRQADARAR